MATPTPPKITRSVITEALEFHEGNVWETAESLGISRRWLYRLMESFGINPDDYRHGGVTISARGVHTSPDCAPDGVNADSVHSENAVTWRGSGTGAKFGAIMRHVGAAIGNTVERAVEDVAAEVERRSQDKPRVRRDLVEKLHRAKRQINAAQDSDLNVSDILNRYLSDPAFDQWVTGQVNKRRVSVSLDQVFGVKVEPEAGPEGTEG